MKDKTEKQFLEYLDRMLAGEPVTLGDDVSDEVRTALEQARLMLAYRREPSAEFRADLRNRLLQQLAEKQAAYKAAEKPGFWERFDSVLPPKPVLIAVVSSLAVVFLLFVGVVLYTGRFGGAPSAPPGAEYSVQLPANIVPEGAYFTANISLSDSAGKAAVYKIESADITADSVTSLGHRLGFIGSARLSADGTRYIMTQGSGDYEIQLTVWTASGAVEYGYLSPEKLYPSQQVQLPSKYMAETIAYDFLQQADLLPSEYQNVVKVEADTTVAAGGGYSVSGRATEEEAPLATASAPSYPPPPSAPSEPSPPPSAPSAEPAPAPVAEEPTTAPTPIVPAPAPPPAPQGPTYWLVEFPYYLDGMEATGPGSKIEVSVGDNSEVVKMVWSWRPVSRLGTDNIISPMQAFEDLTQGKGSIELPLNCKQVSVDQVQLKYWLDPPSEEQDYAVPVYEFTGKCFDKSGNTLEDFVGWTPALATN